MWWGNKSVAQSIFNLFIFFNLAVNQIMHSGKSLHWQNQLASMGSYPWAPLLPSRWLQWTHHTSHGSDCNWLKVMCLSKTSVCLGGCFHCWYIEVYNSKSINTRAIPNQTPTTSKREECYIPSRRGPTPLSNLGGSADWRIAILEIRLGFHFLK